MKKLGSQVTVAIVCCILGFMLAYQFKLLTKYKINPDIPAKSTDITVEVEQYKKEKDELKKQVDELDAQIKKYESAAANRNDISKEVLEELENTRTLIGANDVKGPGLIIYLTPENNFGSSTVREEITDQHIAYIINELRFAEAEAIAVNDIRITSRTGIKSGSNNSYILINEQKISPTKPIIITAIGDKELLYKGLSFQGLFADFKGICSVKLEKSDNIKIPKYTKPYKYEYAKPVK